MNNFLNNRNAMKQKIVHELRLYCIYTLFLALLLSVFVTYQRLLLNEYVNTSFHYGYSLFEALILAKVILIGEHIKLGERYASKPLIYPVLYKTILFCCLLFVFDVLERIVENLFLRTKIVGIYQMLSLTSLDILLAKTLVMLFVFFLFFSFLELGRVLGEGELLKLFFKHNHKISS